MQKSRGLLWRCATILLLLAACSKPKHELKKVVRVATGTAEPQVLATVVTERTTIQPANKTTTTTIVIGSDVARATNEVGQWRLFDFKQNRVAFVNDFAKTYRYESLDSLRERQIDAGLEPISEKIPRAEYALTGARRPILGVGAAQAIVKLGGYQREIWFGSHPLIPPQLFALMLASRNPSTDAPMTKHVDDSLFAIRGFPLLEHSELPFADKKIVTDREVVSVERKNVAASLLAIPGEYTEVKPAPRPVAKPRPVTPPPAPTPEPPIVTTTATTATTATTSTEAPPATTTRAEEKKPVETKKPAPAVKKAPAKKPSVKKATTTKKTTAAKKTTTTKKTVTTKKAPSKKAPAKKAPAKAKTPTKSKE